MLFNSIQFLIFFSIFLILYYKIPHKYRWILILVASCYFYMTVIPIYILVLFLLILIDYTVGILIENSKSQKKKKFFLILSIFANVGLLALFKYFDFFNVNLHALAGLIGWNYSMTLLKLALPIGLSFHTFQSMSYTIEVYRGTHKAERHLGIYACFVMFFPQLVAGPIERGKNLIHQFKEEHYLVYKNIVSGLQLMAWGFFEKVVIADRLALVVDMIYGNVTGYTGIPLIVATVFFAFQIFCDFSGYTNIAIGAAKMMGFDLMKNFRRPYLSKSIEEFWKRWHISLSSWFRDYVYISLGGNRVSIPRWYINLLIVFLVSGLWHGANWTFVIWGALNGVYMILGIVTRPLKNKLMQLTRLNKLPGLVQLFQIVFTFILANIGWVFFRANNVKDAVYVLTHIFPLQLKFSGINIGLDWTGMIIAICSIIVLMVVHLLQENYDTKKFLEEHAWIRWLVYIMIILCILLFGVFKNRTFIYFQF